MDNVGYDASDATVAEARDTPASRSDSAVSANIEQCVIQSYVETTCRAHLP